MSLTRLDVATASPWGGSSYALCPRDWDAAARDLAGSAVAEVRTNAAALTGLPAHELPGALLAAARLRDAGVGLALCGAGRAEHLRWLRLLPWSAVIVHPALLLAIPLADRRRVLDRWTEAVRRRGLAFIAPLRERCVLPSLRQAGFTHGEVECEGAGAGRLAPG